MSGTTKQFLLFAFGLIITVAFIFIGLGIYKRAINAKEIVNQRQESAISALQEADIMCYDGCQITGGEAVNYIKKNYDDVEINVTTTVGTFTVAESQFSDYKKVSSPYYIAPLEMYEVTVTRDGNDVISTVTIKVVP